MTTTSAIRIVTAPIHAIQERPRSGCGASGESICKVSDMKRVQRIMLARMPAGVKMACKKTCSLERAYRPRLATNNEPLNERFGQLGGTHALLHCTDIVRNAPELHRLMLKIGNGEARARISVARLADGARIKEIAARLLDTQCGERFRSARTNLQHFEIGVLIREAALVMGVPEKSNFGSGIEKAVESLRRREDILVFILKRAVY